MSGTRLDINDNRCKIGEHLPGLSHSERFSSRAFKMMGINISQGSQRASSKQPIPRPQHVADQTVPLVDHHATDSTGSEHSVNLPNCLSSVRRVVQHTVGKHQIERIVSKRQCLSVPDPHVRREAIEGQSSCCELNRTISEVNACQRPRTGLRPFKVIGTHSHPDLQDVPASAFRKLCKGPEIRLKFIPRLCLPLQLLRKGIPPGIHFSALRAVPKFLYLRLQSFWLHDAEIPKGDPGTLPANAQNRSIMESYGFSLRAIHATSSPRRLSLCRFASSSIRPLIPAPNSAGRCGSK